MIEKTFRSKQAVDHMSYAFTCGYFFEDFTRGRNIYGNRANLIRPKDPTKLFTEDCEFKNSDFHTIEGIKPLEITQTILMTRQKLEAFYTDKECIKDFLSNFKTEFLTSEDLDKVAENFYDKVGKKLLANKITDFRKLDNFVLGSMVLEFPINIVKHVAEFRHRQVLTLLTQDIITAEDAQQMIKILPDNKENLIALRQKLIKQRAQAQEQKRIEAQQRTVTKETKVYDDDRKEIVAIYRAINKDKQASQTNYYEKEKVSAS